MTDEHLFSGTLLEKLQQKVNSAQPGTGRAALDEVYKEAVYTVVTMRCCLPHCKMAIHLAKDAIFKNTDPRCLSAKMKQQLGYLGVLSMELLCHEVTLMNVQLQGPWKAAAWKAVLMMSYCNPYMMSGMTESYSTIEWTKEVFCSSDLCPSPHLRLEMIRFIMTWPNEVLIEPNISMDVLHTLTDLCSSLTLHDMLPRGWPSLSGPFACLLNNLHDAGLMGIITSRTFAQITRQRIGPEARFFARVTRLLGEKAKVLRYMCHNASLSLSVVLEEYRYLLETLNILVVSNSCKVAFRLPGLVQVGATTLATTALNLYKSSFILVRENRDSFKSLAASLREMFESLWLNNQTLMCELMTSQNKKTMERAARLADQIGFPLHHMNVPPFESPEKGLENCPVPFLDEVTGKIMEQPVQVLSCGTVVDISTLIGFMLFSNDHVPFALLAGLQRKISYWRMNYSSGVQQREFNGPIRHFMRVMVRYGAEWIHSPDA